eukprot:scaffold398_cov177-Ochromonas_danica.AAC.28
MEENGQEYSTVLENSNTARGEGDPKKMTRETKKRKTTGKRQQPAEGGETENSSPLSQTRLHSPTHSTKTNGNPASPVFVSCTLLPPLCLLCFWAENAFFNNTRLVTSSNEELVIMMMNSKQSYYIWVKSASSSPMEEAFKVTVQVDADVDALKRAIAIESCVRNHPVHPTKILRPRTLGTQTDSEPMNNYLDPADSVWHWVTENSSTNPIQFLES